VRGLWGIDAPAGCLDREPVVFVDGDVPPDRIVSVERVAVDLPPRGSLRDWGLRSGMAQRQDDRMARRSIELLQKLGLTLGPLR
jgi:hypothetical protein